MGHRRQTTSRKDHDDIHPASQDIPFALQGEESPQASLADLDHQKQGTATCDDRVPLENRRDLPSVL